MNDITSNSSNNSEIHTDNSNNSTITKSWQPVKYNLLEYSRKISIDSEFDELLNNLEKFNEILLNYRKFYNDYINNLEKTIKELDIRLNLQISRTQMLEDSLIESQKLLKENKNISSNCKKNKSKLFGLF